MIVREPQKGAPCPRTPSCRDLGSSRDGVAALKGDGDFGKALMLAGRGEPPLLDGLDHRVDEDGAATDGRNILDRAIRTDGCAHPNRTADSSVLEHVGIRGRDLLHRLEVRLLRKQSERQQSGQGSHADEFANDMSMFVRVHLEDHFVKGTPFQRTNTGLPTIYANRLRQDSGTVKGADGQL